MKIKILHIQIIFIINIECLLHSPIYLHELTIDKLIIIMICIY